MKRASARQTYGMDRRTPCMLTSLRAYPKWNILRSPPLRNPRLASVSFETEFAVHCGTLARPWPSLAPTALHAARGSVAVARTSRRTMPIPPRALYPGGSRDPAAPVVVDHSQDLALVRRILGGSAEAWDRFLAVYAGLLWAVIRRYMPARDRE